MRKMRTPLVILMVLVALGVAPRSRGQSLSFNTLAGDAGASSSDGPGGSARFVNPWGVAVDAGGNLYVADTDNHTIRKIAPGGVVTTLAGKAGVSGSIDGTGTNALFYQPQGVAVDGSTNLYVADTGNYTIRKITPTGVVTTLAGLAGSFGTNNASGSSARFYEPEGIAVNASGSLIYVADTWNHLIRQVTSAGAVTTLAGSPNNAGTNNGTGTAARFNQPQGIAVDGAGNLYVGDTGNQTIRKITAAGAVTTLAGSPTNYGSANGTGGSATFWDTQGVALDSATNIYVADSFNNTIRKITPGGAVTTLAGTAGTSGSLDGAGGAASFWQPTSVAVDPSGNIFVADSANGTIREIVGTTVSTFAGAASTGSNDGTGGGARFSGPSGAAIDSAGDSYIADTGNGTIRMATPAGVVTTLAGSAGNFGTNDGTGGSARFYGPQGIAANAAGSLVYVADTASHTIRKVTSGGAVTTLAGAGGTNGISDGSGRNGLFNYPQGVAVDISGNLYVADTWNHTIRKVSPAGAVTTLAGFPGSYGDLDSGGLGQGTNIARFYCPSGVAVDTSGNVYVADTRNHSVRMVTPAGVVTTIAGMSGTWGSADGTNGGARFYLPESISVDAAGNLYVLDSGNHTLRQITPSGTNWIVTTIGGTAGVSGSTDGVGRNARFFYPGGIAVNAGGIFSIADWGNNTIRSGSSNVTFSPTIQSQPQNETVNQGQTAIFNVAASGTAPLLYQWFFNNTSIAGATDSTLSFAAQTTNAGTYSVIVSNLLGSMPSSNAVLTVIVPPTITNAPQSLIADQGTNVTFNVSASGSTPFNYLWLFNGGIIGGATASSYTLSNIQPGDAGSYAVIVSNSAGSDTSTPPAVLTVNLVPTSPGIGGPGQPQNLTVNQTSTATFAVIASGSTPFSYQWLFNGGTLGGATASSYTVVNAQSGNAGSYSVIVTKAYGSITSSPALLTVILPPIINSQPASQLSSVSNSVSFTVGLSQGTSPAYQWKQNGSPLAGATQSSLSFASLTWTNAGTYSVIVSNSAGSQTSAPATLVVQQAVFTFFDGFETYNLGVLDNNTPGGPNTASSNPWWGVNSTAQGVVTNASSGVTPHGGSQMNGSAGTVRQEYLNLPYRLNAGQVYYGNFMCDWWFYDPYGSTPNNATNLQDYFAVAEYAPVSTTSDTSTFTTFNQRMSLGAYNGNVGYNYSNYQARIVGGTGTFGSANSWYNTTATRSVGWHHARIVVGIPDPSTLFAPVAMYIDNMTNSTITPSTVGVPYGFNLIELNHEFKNGLACYYDDFTFRAANDPWIVEQPANQTVAPGQNATFNTVAVGTAYQWQFNGNNISGATSSSYTVVSAAATNVGPYTCVVSGTNGPLATTPANLIVTAPPAIVSSPSSLTVTQNTGASFSVTAAGAQPFSYQWQFNSAPITGATNTSYTLLSAQSTDAGSYSVIVTNIYGGATSDVASLTVLVPPSITNPPLSQMVQTGNCVTLTIGADGTAPLSYQWNFNGVPQAGATTTSFLACNAGSYSVLVSNIAGMLLSDPAVLTLTNPAAPVQPGSFAPPAVLGDGSVQLTMSGTPYTNYLLQYTADWTNWTTLTTLSSSNGIFQFNDSSAATNADRFYRLRLAP